MLSYTIPTTEDLSYPLPEIRWLVEGVMGLLRFPYLSVFNRFAYLILKSSYYHHPLVDIKTVCNLYSVCETNRYR